jgi:hypothetical protein
MPFSKSVDSIEGICSMGFIEIKKATVESTVAFFKLISFIVLQFFECIAFHLWKYLINKVHLLC